MLGHASEWSKMIVCAPVHYEMYTFMAYFITYACHALQAIHKFATTIYIFTCTEIHRTMLFLKGSEKLPNFVRFSSIKICIKKSLNVQCESFKYHKFTPQLPWIWKKKLISICNETLTSSTEKKINFYVYVAFIQFIYFYWPNTMSTIVIFMIPFIIHSVHFIWVTFVVCVHHSQHYSKYQNSTIIILTVCIVIYVKLPHYFNAKLVCVYVCVCSWVEFKNK